MLNLTVRNCKDRPAQPAVQITLKQDRDQQICVCVSGFSDGRGVSVWGVMNNKCSAVNTSNCNAGAAEGKVAEGGESASKWIMWGEKKSAPIQKWFLLILFPCSAGSERVGRSVSNLWCLVQSLMIKWFCREHALMSLVFVV